MVIIKDLKIHFGDSRYEDYTTHQDDDRKRLYLLRTAKQPYKDIRSPSFWSKNLLWNKKSLTESIDDIEGKYDIKILRK